MIGTPSPPDDDDQLARDAETNPATAQTSVGNAAPGERNFARTADVVATVLLHIPLVSMVWLFVFFDGMSLAEGSCYVSSGCNRDQVLLASSLVPAVPFLIFGLSVVLSVVFFIRRWVTFVVPLVAGAAVIISFLIWNHLIQSA